MRVLALTGLVTVLLAACGGSDPAPSRPPATVALGKVQKGIATFYDADGTGNCGFDASPDDLMVVAPNKERLYAGAALCGACLRVTGAKGSVIVRVTDSCPLDTPDNDCGDTGADLDLSAQAFARIDDPDRGKVEVTFEVVTCDVKGPLRFRFKEGSSQWWTAIQVRNHRVPIAEVAYERDGAFVPMKREDYNYFIEEKGVGERPNGLKLRVTASDGRVIEETLPRIGDAETLDGTKQFD